MQRWVAPRMPSGLENNVDARAASLGRDALHSQPGAKGNFSTRRLQPEA